jgi:hypothetical protein
MGHTLFMSQTSGMIVLVCGAAGFAGAAMAQQAPAKQLNARELFYSAVQTPAANPPAKAAPQTVANRLRRRRQHHRRPLQQRRRRLHNRLKPQPCPAGPECSGPRSNRRLRQGRRSA